MLLLSTAWASQRVVPEFNRMLDRASNEVVAEKLDAVLRGELDLMSARYVVQVAGSRGLRDQVPKLKLIAEAEAGREHRQSVVCDALHAIAKLEPSQDYLLANARDPASRKYLAYYSILLLAAQADDAILLQLRKIKAESKDDDVKGAVARAEYVSFWSKRYADMASLDDKLEFLTGRLRGGWDISGVVVSEPNGSRAPEVVWAKRQMLELSRTSPALVAAKLYAMAPSKESPILGAASFMEYVLRFVTEETRAEYKKLTEANPIPRPALLVPVSDPGEE